MECNFETFLRQHRAKIGSIGENVTLEELFSLSGTILELSNFKATRDIFLYSKLLETLLNFVPPSLRVTTLVDLGAGSSVPTIYALSKIEHNKLIKVIAVDNDEEAILVSKGNVSNCGLDDRYTFVMDDMLHFLQCHPWDVNHIVVANPPYLPIPEDIDDPFYGPVNGGPDGTRYLLPILLTPFPSGTVVALRWCSLSNPSKIIETINKLYEVKYVEAYKTHFGNIYLGTPLIRNHIIEQAKLGKAVYGVGTDEGDYSFIFVSCILRRI